MEFLQWSCAETTDNYFVFLKPCNYQFNNTLNNAYHLICYHISVQDADSDPTGEAVHTTQQTLTFYELDLGLNHVVRKYSEPLEEHGNVLISVPGGNDGPSGVLVCSENYITYKNFGDQPDIRMPIPRRKVRKISIVKFASVKS